ncbi:ABC transporter ATP-binding protein/permease [Clostridium felsineum]|uniref:ABC transporter ATP-binding protein/permease n=1 Tax=Clostridium felsineum TaxID=36839 RepID=UPI0009C7DCE9|nr:ABC transporter ATP-binding protein/permease [Clostridium felsineum]URZ01630.1 hypothetical protein CLAUR_016250 [Clostridium felsineum]
MVLQDTHLFTVTIRDADKIMVIDGGEIIEIGNYDELIKKGEYYHMCFNQFKNSEEED